MTKILDQAIDAVSRLSPDEQDEIARTIRLQTLESKGFKPVPGGGTRSECRAHGCSGAPITTL